jgi:hypothetical protein
LAAIATLVGILVTAAVKAFEVRPNKDLTGGSVMTVRPDEAAIQSGKSLLCSGYIDLPLAHHITHQPLKPVFRLGIPCFFYASSGLWPEIRWVVRATKAKWNKVVNLVIWVNPPTTRRTPEIVNQNAPKGAKDGQEIETMKNKAHSEAEASSPPK